MLNPDLLPPRAQALVEHLGLAHALRVVEAYGGLPFRVPVKPNDDLIARLGADCAQALCYHFGGEVFKQVPRCRSALLAERDRQIRAAHAEGKSKVDLAREYGLTWKWVLKICTDTQTAPRARHNLDLFD